MDNHILYQRFNKDKFVTTYTKSGSKYDKPNYTKKDFKTLYKELIKPYLDNYELIDSIFKFLGQCHKLQEAFKEENKVFEKYDFEIPTLYCNKESLMPHRITLPILESFYEMKCHSNMCNKYGIDIDNHFVKYINFEDAEHIDDKLYHQWIGEDFFKKLFNICYDHCSWLNIDLEDYLYIRDALMFEKKEKKNDK